jgi:predicted ArsR family transcriptional regulator
MDSFDERILAVLKDGNSRLFTQLLSEVGFSHNTLRLHLERLEAQGFVVKEKALPNSLGRPKLAYGVPARVRQQVSVGLLDPTVEIVALPFSRLKHLCRFEKGGYCKQAKKNCEAGNCPKILKKK